MWSRYMYKNAMSMDDTVFTMNVADDGSMSGSATADFASTMPLERFKIISAQLSHWYLAALWFKAICWTFLFFFCLSIFLIFLLFKHLFLNFWCLSNFLIQVIWLDAQWRFFKRQRLVREHVHVQQQHGHEGDHLHHGCRWLSRNDQKMTQPQGCELTLFLQSFLKTFLMQQ